MNILASVFLLGKPFTQRNSLPKFWTDIVFFRTHMQDLKDVTQEVHYENYRAERLSRTEQGAPSPKRSIENM